MGSFDGEVPITQLPDEFQQPASKKNRGFVLDEDQFKKYRFVERYRPIILIWLLIMLPIVGGFVGYGIKSFFGEEKGSSQDSTKIDSLVENPVSTEEENQMQQAYDRLSAEDLTFAEVMALDSLVSAHPEYVSSLGLDSDKINDYIEIVNTIQDWKTTKKIWKYVTFTEQVNNSRLDSLHKQCVACLCDVNIVPSINAVQRYYQRHPDEFQSFEDLKKLLKVTEPRERTPRRDTRSAGRTTEITDGTLSTFKETENTL